MGGNGTIDLSQIPLMTRGQEGALAELLPAVMGMMSGFPLGEAYQPGAYDVRAFPEFSLGDIIKKDGDGGGGGGDGDVIRKEQLVDPNKKITKEQLTAPGDGDGGGDGKKKIISNGTAVPKSEYGGKEISESVLDLILNPEQYISPIKQFPTPVQPSIPQQSPTSIPSMGGEGKGGTAGPLQQRLPPGIQPPGGMTGMAGGGVGGGKGGASATVPEMQPISPIQQALTQPIISPFTQGMTGNYPKRPMGGR